MALAWTYARPSPIRARGPVISQLGSQKAGGTSIPPIASTLNLPGFIDL
jgi:hypothetical protein